MNLDQLKSGGAIMHKNSSSKEKDQHSFRFFTGDPGKVVGLGLLILCSMLMMVQFSHTGEGAGRVTHGVNIGVMDQPFFPHQGKWTGLMNISIENTGSTDDFFSLECTRSPEEWDIIILEGSVEIGTDPPFNVKVVGIVVNCPQMEEEGSYPINLKATCLDDVSCSDSIEIELEVLLAPRVKVEGPLNADPRDVEPANGIPDYREGKPGDVLTYEFSICNVGNGEEAFFISVESPNNWWIELQGASSTLPLAINQTVTKSVKIKIPDDADNGESDVLKFTATAQSNTDVHNIMTVESVVKQIYLVSLETALSSTYSYPDSEVELLFNITNEGNGVDNTLEVKISSLPEGWGGDTDLSDVGVVGIPIYGKAICELSVLVPKEALNRTYSITLDAYSGGKQISDSFLIFHITVFQEFSFHLQQGPPSQKGFPGDELLFNFTLENSGNGEDTFAIFLMKESGKEESGWFNTKINMSSLESGRSQEILVDCQIPQMTMSGEYSVTIRISSLGAADMELIVRNELVFTVQVKKEYKLKISLMDKENGISINSDGLGVQSRTKVVHFNVTNLGNSQDIVVFYVDYPKEKGWTYPDFVISRAMLQYGEYKNDLGLILIAPRGIPVGTYHFTIFVNSTKDPSENPATDSIHLKVNIVRYDVGVNSTVTFNSRPISRGEMITGMGMEEVHITIQINNLGELFIEQVNVSLFINDEFGQPAHLRTAYKLAKGDSDTLTFYFQPTSVGKYDLILMVDPNNVIPEKDETNNKFNFTYIIVNVEEAHEGESGTLNLFGREWTAGEFVLLIVAAISFLILVGVILVRTSSLRTHKKKKDSGLVEGGEYKFKERTDGDLDLFDMDDLMADEDGLEVTARSKRDGKKGKKGAYYIIKDAEKDSERSVVQTGFTVSGSAVTPSYQTGYQDDIPAMEYYDLEQDDMLDMYAYEDTEEEMLEYLSSDDGGDAEYFEHTVGDKKDFFILDEGKEGDEKADIDDFTTEIDEERETTKILAWDDSPAPFFGTIIPTDTSTGEKAVFQTGGEKDLSKTIATKPAKRTDDIFRPIMKPAGSSKTITTKPTRKTDDIFRPVMKPAGSSKTITTKPSGRTEGIFRPRMRATGDISTKPAMRSARKSVTTKEKK